MDILARAGRPVDQNSWGGAAEDGRINFIDTRDVADVAKSALFDDSFIDAQRAYHLTGSRACTMDEVAEILSSLLERPVRYKHRSPAEQRLEWIKGGASEFTADLLLGLDKMFRASFFCEVTSTVELLTGHPPRPISDWLSRNLDLFK